MNPLVHARSNPEQRQPQLFVSDALPAISNAAPGTGVKLNVFVFDQSCKLPVTDTTSCPAYLMLSTTLSIVMSQEITCIGFVVGCKEGELVGFAVGSTEGELVGLAVGGMVGIAVGCKEGELVGFLVLESTGTGMARNEANLAPELGQILTAPAAVASGSLNPELEAHKSVSGPNIWEGEKAVLEPEAIQPPSRLEVNPLSHDRRSPEHLQPQSPFSKALPVIDNIAPGIGMKLKLFTLCQFPRSPETASSCPAYPTWSTALSIVMTQVTASSPGHHTPLQPVHKSPLALQ